MRTRRPNSDKVEVSSSTKEGESLRNPRYSEVASIKNFYLSHGGTEEKWLEWAGAAGKAELAPLPRRSLDFTQEMPDFMIKDFSDSIGRMDHANNPHATATAREFQDVDRKHSFQKLSPRIISGPAFIVPF